MVWITMRGALALLVCMLTACATGGGAAPNKEEPAAWQPLPPASLGESRSALQQLKARYREREITLECVVEVSPESIQIVGTLPGGMRVFSVSYDGAEMRSKIPPAVPATVLPESLLLDLQLAFWPLTALQSAVNPQWTVVEPDARTRRLLHRGLLVAEVHRADADPWNGRVWLANFAHGYSLSIDSRPLE